MNDGTGTAGADALSEYVFYRLVPKLADGTAWPAPRFTLADGKGERADPDTLNRVYAALIERLGLTHQHRAALVRRGLKACFAAHGYATLGKGRASAVRALIEAGMESHFPRVPGLFVQERERSRYWTVAGPAGILVPVCDAAGRIVALSVRADEPGQRGKYRAVSSKGRGGPGPGSPIHVPRFFNGDRTTVRVTEGALKANVATQLGGLLTVGLPSAHTAWRRAVPILREVGAKVVRVALDADARTNRGVARSLSCLVSGLRDEGFAVELERWALADGKGIDDLLAAGKAPEVLTGDAVLAAAAEILSAAEAADPPPSPAPVDASRPNEDPDDPHRLARLFLDPSGEVPNPPHLRYWAEEWIEWDGAAYRRANPKEVRARLTASIKAEFDRLNRQELQEYDQRRRGGGNGAGDQGPPRARKVTAALVTNALQALSGMTVLSSAIEPPAWLRGDEPFPAGDVLAARNALVNLAALVDDKPDYAVAPTPRFFTFNALEYDFDRHAPEPKAWQTFLSQLWPDDPDSIQVLQEWFGYCLTGDTRQHKMLLMVGPKRSGKGTIARVFRALIGAGNVAGPTLSSLGGPFGLQPLLGKTLAIISDARLSGRTDSAMVTERLLSISGEDALTIDRKHLSSVTTKLPTRFMILTNELPRLGDSSGALASRFLMLRLAESWYGREDKTLTDRLLPELPGILLWGIAGWEQLRERGHFVQPESARELLGEMEDLSSPVGAFVRECCAIGPGFRVTVSGLYVAWKDWCEQRGRDPGNRETFGRNLRAAVPALRVAQPRLGEGGKQIRAYEGIRLAGDGTPDPDTR